MLRKGHLFLIPRRVVIRRAQVAAQRVAAGGIFDFARSAQDDSSKEG
ncbi:MAG: hypothetical protein WB810_07125 [Candidatus Cybelea sp.]